MVRSSSAEPAKTNKRKGTRSVSNLTPSQLARKRANDRKAQRAIRARTKEYIERLERGLDELKSKQSRDQTVQELLRRNKAAEDELNRLKENMGISMASSPYSTPVDDDNLSTGSGAIPNPRTPPFPSGDYNTPLADYSQQHIPLPNNCESWANTVPCPIPSNISSPSSSANTDDYNAGYIPTSVPISMPPSNNSNTNVNALSHKDIKLEYKEVESHGTGPHRLGKPEDANHSPFPEAGFRLSNPPMPPPHPSYMQPLQLWNVYPVYYPPAQSSVP
ncbi:hypothetical protein EDB81DRAFT_848930 [Dactylonectria macrodidyma]|uniref:BZIP domain-containing protein n=1 Tax=Dactylonectria macrodidyma TaxID=307937 RepID=A0A9P9D3Z5_9HYPO|nr:hypothetical protein EDB81DRAFT_848930 [Dactylonectria macrodidyma]